MTEHHHFLQGFLDRSGIPPAEAAELLTASDHPYQCRCEKCLRWWASVGPEEDDQGRQTFGPFTAAEVAACRKKGEGRA
jgi:hypothetical protein